MYMSIIDKLNNKIKKSIGPIPGSTAGAEEANVQPIVDEKPIVLSTVPTTIVTGKPDECPVCSSVFVAVATQLSVTGQDPIGLYYCMDCESFFTPFAPESEETGLPWHKHVFERNLGWTDVFLEKLAPFYKPTKIIDVGCGIGSLIHAAGLKGISGVGFDIDSESIKYGRETYGLDVRDEFWTSKYEIDMPAKGGLITCMSVLEHIKWPREFFSELIEGGRRLNSKVYISVPFFNRILWEHLAAPDDQTSPLRASMQHVTHYSDQGFVAMCEWMKVKDYKRLGGFHWPGYLITP